MVHNLAPLASTRHEKRNDYPMILTVITTNLSCFILHLYYKLNLLVIGGDCTAFLNHTVVCIALFVEHFGNTHTEFWFDPCKLKLRLKISLDNYNDKPDLQQCIYFIFYLLVSNHISLKISLNMSWSILRRIIRYLV